MLSYWFKYYGYFMSKTIFNILLIALCLTGCSTTQTFTDRLFSHPHPTEARVNTQTFATDPAFWQGDTQTLWGKLQRIPLQKLEQARTQTTDSNIAGWIALAIINKQYSTNSIELANQLITWRTTYPSHAGNSLIPDNAALTNLISTQRPHHFVLLLPLTGSLGSSGQAIRDGFLSAYYETLAKSNNQQTISFYDTNKNPDVNALYQQALSEGADTIIGPLTKPQVSQLLSGQGHFPVPTLALNYTTMWLQSLPANFYEYGLNPQDEALQIADKARQQNLSRAIVIAPKTDWGKNAVKTLVSRWQSIGGSISDTYYFSKESDLTQDIAKLMHINTNEDSKRMKEKDSRASLEQQRRHDFDVIFLLAPPVIARQIVPTLKYYYLGNIPIYATSIIYSGTPNSQKDYDLNGVIFCDIPWTLGGNQRSDRLYAIGRDAYYLTNPFTRMTLLPNFPLYGATGGLSLTSQQQIYRRLAWAQMHDGHP